MKLETKRLLIVPLNLEQFKILLNSIEEMEKALGLNPSHETLDEHTKQAMEWLYNEALKDKENYLWSTNWQIISEKENISIGSACFMKSPDENGVVEIGYGINPSFQKKGYMTEALSAICGWALSQPNVKFIIAETEIDNLASHRVLEKCGMKKYKESEESLWWKIDKT